MTAWFLLTLLQAPAAGQECSIAGHVYSSNSGSPLKKAQLRIAGKAMEAPVFSDAEGAFHFDHLTPGNHAIVAERNGYLQASMAGIACGASDVSIQMIQQGMIFGRVIDDDGEPVGSASVGVYRRAWFHGQRRLQMFQSTFSQADGSFVIGKLASGNYYLSAKGTVHVPAGEASVENFYPNTPDVDAAAAVNATAGADVRGIDLRIRAARVYTIRGKAFNVSGEPVTGVPLMLLSLNETNRGGMSNTGTTGGVFAFENIAPGSYVIQALPYGERNSVNRITAHVPVSVGDRDVTDVRVTLGPGAEVSGIVKLGDAPAAQTFQVSLEPLKSGGLADSANVAKGAFELRSIAPTLYRVTIAGLADGYCIQSIKFGGRDLVRRELDLGSGAGGTLEIQLSAKPASISGTVRNANGDPAVNATVYAWSKDDPEVHSVVSGNSGQFTFRNLAPGEYRVIAFESIERGVIENPGYQASFDGQAAVVAIQEASQGHADLKLIPQSASDTEIAKLP